jgi:hypothetical protein
MNTHVLRRAVRPLLLLGCLLVIAAGAAAQQQPSRLLVINKTGASVELFAFVRTSWQSRGRISPGASMPVQNVTNGQRFRAVWGSRSKEHTVKLVYNREYGGWQDQLLVP